MFFSAEHIQGMEQIIDFFVDDNYAANTKMSRDAGIPFVDCKSHLLNLDVQYFIGKESEAVTQAQESRHFWVRL